MVALVGLSGSGKTSLVSLILRFYDVKSGSISLGGHDITTLDPTYLRAKVATVPQEPALFSVSMHDNIAYGLPNVSRAEVEAAASLANAHGFISAMPGGFDTVVGTRGITLSGGAHARIHTAMHTAHIATRRAASLLQYLRPLPLPLALPATCYLLPATCYLVSGSLCTSQQLGCALCTMCVCVVGTNKQTNRPASARRNRPCAAAQTVPAHPRRGDVRPRYSERGCCAQGGGGYPQGWRAWDSRDCTSSLDGEGCDKDRRCGAH
jgi:hypothetical protein